MKKYLFVLLLSIFIIQDSVAPPVTKDKKEESENEVDEKEELGDVMEYHRYLKEVVQALESDPTFRAKLENTNETDIRNGKIAHELEFVSHHVRTKLDELKRAELERLRHLAIKEYELENGLDPTHMKIPEHVDHANPHTFEIDDLKKLIAKTTKDLNEVDRRRREEFKQYEMNKKFEQEEAKKKLDEAEQKKYEAQIEELQKKHRDHEPLHHPGSKKQLEEVWEKQDHMENQEFDPRTFFYLHDLDGNGVWDQNELKTLFLKELDKLYSEGHPEDDLVERAEELERMREHVIKEVDLNKDGLISYKEFLNESKKADFNEDPGWKPIDEQQIYTEQEYEAYKIQKAREIERAIAKGMSQEYPAGHPQAGHEQFPPYNQIPHQDYMHQQQPQYQQHQVPQQQHYPQHGQYPNQMPPQHGQFNQMPPHPDQFGNQQQYHQVPPQHNQFANQVPQQQFHPNQQVPINNNINQIPHQQNYPPSNQQVPVGQNQIPHQQFQPPAPPGGNQISQQQYIQQAGQQPNQQQFNQQAGQQPNQQQFNQQAGQQPNQQQLNQQAGHQPNQQQINQQANQQANQQPPVGNNLNQAPPPQVQQNQQPPVAVGQNQQNTQNQVPQQTHEQISSINNAQAHQNAPNVAKT